MQQTLFTSTAALQQQRLASTKRDAIVSRKSKQKRPFRPTRRPKTLGISEDFDVFLSRTAYSATFKAQPVAKNENKIMTP